MKSANLSSVAVNSVSSTRISRMERARRRTPAILVKHAMLLDANGNAALVRLADLPHGIIKSSYGMKVWETDEVIKPPSKTFQFPLVAPLAHVVRAQTRYGREQFGDKAVIWEMGLQNDSGFSIPAADIINSLYVVVPNKESH